MRAQHPSPGRRSPPGAQEVVRAPAATGGMWSCPWAWWWSCSSLACAPQFVGPTTTGYFFALNDSTPYIILGDTTELIISVRNAQGQLVDSLPVTFQVEPGWTQNASVLPQVAYTRQGRARALFQANTIGVVHVAVRVDNTTQEARITVAPRPEPAGDE